MRKPIYKVMEFKDLKEMLKKSGEKYGERPAYMYRTDKPGKFRYISHKQFRDEINALGTALIDLGLKDKRIAVISENRYEWGLAYLAIVTGTGVVVPLDKSLPNNEIESLIERSEVEAIFYSKKYDSIMNKIKE
ncbi:MAG: AMP-binding protein, partial [Clostridia bacterium]|nr:AMP-binding protein [Clostridia bacterium]